ncbi:MAG TPA: hypothetical protein DCY94_02345 [Firmicutes bacterium]|nr:hypothetical protein [Bacillota bacterium]
MENEFDSINIFDFDGTLTTETWPKFWVWVKKFGYNGIERNAHLESALAEYRKKHEGDALSTFFGFFNDLLVDNNETLSIEELMEGEKYIRYNPGLDDFLKKTDTKNYIVSGGLKDFLEHLKVTKCFDGIYGSSLKYDEKGKIIGIGEIMTDDKKISAIRDILKRNNREGNDCRDVYYVGDGYSDANAMKFVHDNGGKAIFVYQPNEDDELSGRNNEIYELLNADGIVDFSFLADYRDGSELSNILKR